MGLREKVALALLVVVFYKTACSVPLPHSLKNNPFEKYLRQPKYGRSIPLSSYSNADRQKNQRFQENFDIYKTYNFPEVDFPSDHTPKVSIYGLNSEYENSGKTSSIDVLSDSALLNNLRKEKRRKRKNKQIEKSYTRSDLPTATLPESSQQLFPEVQYPLTAAETWSPNYWNQGPTNKEDPYFRKDHLIYQNKQKNKVDSFIQKSTNKGNNGMFAAITKSTNETSKVDAVKNLSGVKNNNTEQDSKEKLLPAIAEVFINKTVNEKQLKEKNRSISKTPVTSGLTKKKIKPIKTILSEAQLSSANKSNLPKNILLEKAVTRLSSKPKQPSKANNRIMTCPSDNSTLTCFNSTEVNNSTSLLLTLEDNTASNRNNESSSSISKTISETLSTDYPIENHRNVNDSSKDEKINNKLESSKPEITLTDAINQFAVESFPAYLPTLNSLQSEEDLEKPASLSDDSVRTQILDVLSIENYNITALKESILKIILSEKLNSSEDFLESTVPRNILQSGPQFSNNSNTEKIIESNLTDSSLIEEIIEALITDNPINEEWSKIETIDTITDLILNDAKIDELIEIDSDPQVRLVTLTNDTMSQIIAANNNDNIETRVLITSEELIVPVESEPIGTEVLADNLREIISKPSTSHSLIEDLREVIRLLTVWNSQIEDSNEIIQETVKNTTSGYNLAEFIHGAIERDTTSEKNIESIQNDSSSNVVTETIPVLKSVEIIPKPIVESTKSLDNTAIDNNTPTQTLTNNSYKFLHDDSPQIKPHTSGSNTNLAEKTLVGSITNPTGSNTDTISEIPSFDKISIDSINDKPTKTSTFDFSKVLSNNTDSDDNKRFKNLTNYSNEINSEHTENASSITFETQSTVNISDTANNHSSFDEIPTSPSNSALNDDDYNKHIGNKTIVAWSSGFPSTITNSDIISSLAHENPKSLVLTNMPVTDTIANNINFKVFDTKPLAKNAFSYDSNESFIVNNSNQIHTNKFISETVDDFAADLEIISKSTGYYCSLAESNETADLTAVNFDHKLNDTIAVSVTPESANGTSNDVFVDLKSKLRGSNDNMMYSLDNSTYIDEILDEKSSSEFVSTFTFDDIISSLAETEESGYPSFLPSYIPSSIDISHSNPNEIETHDNPSEEVCPIIKDSKFKYQCYIFDEPNSFIDLNSSSNISDVITGKLLLTSLKNPLKAIHENIIFKIPLINIPRAEFMAKNDKSNNTIEIKDKESQEKQKHTNITNTEKNDTSLLDFSDYILLPEDDLSTDFFDDILSYDKIEHSTLELQNTGYSLIPLHDSSENLVDYNFTDTLPLKEISSDYFDFSSFMPDETKSSNTLSITVQAVDFSNSSKVLENHTTKDTKMYDIMLNNNTSIEDEASSEYLCNDKDVLSTIILTDLLPNKYEIYSKFSDISSPNAFTGNENVDKQYENDLKSYKNITSTVESNINADFDISNTVKNVRDSAHGKTNAGIITGPSDTDKETESSYSYLAYDGIDAEITTGPSDTHTLIETSNTDSVHSNTDADIITGISDIDITMSTSPDTNSVQGKTDTDIVTETSGADLVNGKTEATIVIETSDTDKVTQSSGAYKVTEAADADKVTEVSDIDKIAGPSDADKVTVTKASDANLIEGKTNVAVTETSDADSTDGKTDTAVTETSDTAKVTEPSDADKETGPSDAEKVIETFEADLIEGKADAAVTEAFDADLIEGKTDAAVTEVSDPNEVTGPSDDKVTQPSDTDKETEASNADKVTKASDAEKVAGSSDADKITDTLNADKVTDPPDADKVTETSDLEQGKTNAGMVTGPSDADKVTKLSDFDKVTGPSDADKVTETSGANKVTKTSDTDKVKGLSDTDKKTDLSDADKETELSDANKVTETSDAYSVEGKTDAAVKKKSKINN